MGKSEKNCDGEPGLHKFYPDLKREFSLFTGYIKRIFFY